jgi:type IV pilus assembly protein PilY1
MFNTRQTILASRPAATVLALVLVAGLTTPFLLLPRAHADDAPLECTVVNNNGCTELSATPPEDIPAVPPNVVLMLDDSGSMQYDYMPDWDYLTTPNQWGARDPAVNGVYYNPAYNQTGDATTAGYKPPPKADGTFYPDSPSFLAAYADGFTDTTHTKDVRQYSATADQDLGHQFAYGVNLPTTLFNTTDVDKGPADWGGGSPGSPGSPGVPGHCPSGYNQDPGDPSQCIRDPVATIGEIWTCNPGDSYVGNHGPDHNQCRHRERSEHGWDDTYYDATDGGPKCPSGTTYASTDGLCHYPPQAWIPPVPPTPPTDPIPDYKWVCNHGGTTDPGAPPPPSDPPRCVAHTNTRIYVYGFMYVQGSPVQANTRFVVPAATDADPDAVKESGWCSVLYPGTGSNMWNGYHMDSDHCVAADDTTKVFSDGTRAAPEGVTPGQNIANWFSYYRTRMLMAKSSMMIAFSGLSPDFKFRFGFASINGNGKNKIPDDPNYVTFDDSSWFAGDANNRLAVVQPFGDGSDPDSQKAKFWDWLANESPANGTPLRKALQAVGEYYKTEQPWTSMPNDPGYTDSSAQFACRASFTILTTDGFWNGADPTGIGYAAGSDGPTQTVPGGNPFNKYTAEAPFSGGGVDGGAASLADVATYYWEHDLSDMANEDSAGTTDPATWQHMTTYTIGMGVDPPTGPQGDGTNGIMPAGTAVSDIFAWAHDLDNAVPHTPIDGFSWPTPDSGSVYNIADLAHAAVNGRGAFFNAKSPQELADAFNQITHQIGERTVTPSPSAVNASVVSLGALSFSTGYTTGDWSGNMWGVSLNADGTGNPNALWKAESSLATFHSSSGYTSRSVYTDSYKMADGSGTFDAFQFNVANTAKLDTTQTDGLESPALSGADDTLDHRIQYLLGDNTYEVTSPPVYRPRATLLGAILRSAPVYVAGATGGYYNSWPNPSGGGTAPENDAGAQTYDAFVTQQSTQTGTVFVGANDGMLHAFDAPVPTCSTYDSETGNCSLYVAGDGAGEERWAFIPRAVYANLGNLTQTDFSFRPTVDATPVRRDVFFSGDKNWHTILAGGVGVGGRGVYALDITKPDNFKAPLNASDYPASGVLWEFDADMTDKTAGCVSVGNSHSTSCNASDLGYTVSQPNIARLANGKWVVLVPNGYFPDCTTPDIPTADQASCETIAAQVPLASGKPYSALFVIDAETGAVIAELKTPTDDVTSFGLASPVVGDYDNDQVDDVAFAGDAQGNLWRFDLGGTGPTDWTVTLVYKGISGEDDHQGVQPITTMPRLFPDPVTNRFMVVFGTGRLLGVGDNSNGTTQAIIAVRDVEGTTYEQDDLQPQYLHEYVEPEFLPDGETPNPLAGTSVRCVTGGEDDTCDVDDETNPATQVNDVPASKGGWYINLYTTTSDGTHNDAGERVVVNPGAIFASNTVVFETLITGALNTDACNPATEGSILALNATSGGPSGVSALGGWPIAGGRIKNAKTSGSLPIMSALGGGQAYLPGAELAPSGNPMSIDAPIWRRRSWQQIKQNP